jgi:hypothetical protein
VSTLFKELLYFFFGYFWKIWIEIAQCLGSLGGAACPVDCALVGA